ncbi:MAG: DUF2779 domain-containing protein [Acholeplasmatales bacterium]|nr:MAG: DUF2779 domain-containing protein [Acholeplasmatales bacterium]
MRISKTRFLDLLRCPRFYDYTQSVGDTIDPLDQDILEHLTGDAEDLETLTKAQEAVLNGLHERVEREASTWVRQRLGGHTIDLDTSGGQHHVERSVHGHVWTAELDILNPTDTGVHVIEVKASTTSELSKLDFKLNGVYHPVFVKNNHVHKLVEETAPYLETALQEKYLKARKNLFDRLHKVGRHVYDLAFQRFVYEGSIDYDSAKAHTYYLALLNKDYHHDGQETYDVVNGEHVISLIDLTTITEELQSVVAEDVRQVVDYIDQHDNRYQNLIKACQKGTPRACPYLTQCNPYLKVDYNVDELMGSSYKDTARFAHQESKPMIADLDEADRSKKPKWRMQYDAIVHDTIHVDQASLKAFLSHLEYPVYHLDFESFAAPLPRFKGEKPYQQHVFQVSLHIEREAGMCDNTLDHVEFLAEDHRDCRHDVVAFLLEHIDLSAGGTVLVWHKTFERERLKELALAIPKYASELQHIRDAVVDLKDGFLGKGALPILYKKALHGKYSIKFVLPAYTSITYEGMAINNGLLAATTYATYPVIDPAHFDHVLDAMRTYCKQDTWAMVTLLDVCRNLIEQNSTD